MKFIRRVFFLKKISEKRMRIIPRGKTRNIFLFSPLKTSTLLQQILRVASAARGSAEDIINIKLEEDNNE